MALLITLRGNSGSGKTSVARALQRRFGRGTLLISQDAVRRDMLLARDGADTPALPLLEDLLVYGRKNCAVVLLEGILRADWYAPLFEAARREFGEDILSYYWDIPFEETLRRHATKPNQADFGAEEMRQWWRARDLSPLLSERVFSEDVSLEAAVARVLRDAGSAPAVT